MFQVAGLVLAMSIPMDQDDIAELARQINETIMNLTNIDQILNETAADLATSDSLKERADNARYPSLHHHTLLLRTCPIDV